MHLIYLCKMDIELQNEKADSDSDSSVKFPQIFQSILTAADVDINSRDNCECCWLNTCGTPAEDDVKCSHNHINDSLVLKSMKSSSAQNHVRNKKCCRPSADQLLNILKQSNLWSNLSQIDSVKLLHISQNLLENTLNEWSKRLWGNRCSSNHSAEYKIASNLAQNQQSKETRTSTMKIDTATCKTESVSISDETVQQLTEYLIGWKAMNVEPVWKKSDTIDRHVDVLILGGGLAGLGAAVALNKQQCNAKQCSYLILESSNQAGGRVKTVEIQKYVPTHHEMMNEKLTNDKQNESNLIDAGAQWLHGRNNFLYDISEHHQLLAAEQSEEGLGTFFYENGEEINPYLVKTVDFHIGKLLEECEQFAHTKKMDTYPKSVGHFLRERFQTFVDSLKCAEDQNCALDLFDWHVRFQTIDNSCLTLDQLSAKFWGNYSFNGESCQAHYNFKNGFGSVVDCIVSELEDDSIHYNKQVIDIRIHDIHSEMNNNDRDPDEQNISNLISVKCSDGSVYEAKHVVVTFSLGILKRQHKDMFHPALPAPMSTAIESIGFETINKIFLEFSTPWWNNLDGIQFIFKHNEKKRDWTHFLIGFDILYPSCHPNKYGMLGWVGGTGAIQMETLSDNQIIEDCINLLSNFTKTIVPYPTHYYCTRWHSNPFTCGAYSYISTDCDNNHTISHNLLNQALTLDDFYTKSEIKMCDNNDDDDEINGKIHKKRPNHSDSVSTMPVMLFAGEACHDKYFSTAHGAFLSGMEQTQKILQHYNK